MCVVNSSESARVSDFSLHEIFAVIRHRTVVRNQGASINFQGGACSYALYNLKSLFSKFTNKYICFNNFFNIRGLEAKDNYLTGAW